MSPTCNRTTALQRFERSTMIEMRNGVMFDFYLGLPHVYMYLYTYNNSLIISLRFKKKMLLLHGLFMSLALFTSDTFHPRFLQRTL